MTGYVTAVAGLNLRSEADTNGQVLYAMPYGAPVEILNTTGDWLRVRHGGNVGFVAARWVGQQDPKVQTLHFEKAIAFVLKWEGGLSLDPADSGNWTGGAPGRGMLSGTKHGISAAAFPGVDISKMTLEQAKSLYERYYWLASGADKLTGDMGLVVLDSAVQHGVTQAKVWLNKEPESPMAYLALRLDFYTKLSSWGRYGGAWARRVADLMAEVSNW